MAELTGAPDIGTVEDGDLLPARKSGAAGVKKATIAAIGDYIAQKYLGSTGTGGGGSSGSGGSGSGSEVIPGSTTKNYPLASRYRLRTLAPGSDNVNAAWGEIEFTLDNYAGISLAGGTASASSFAVGFEPEKAFDLYTNAGNGWKCDVAAESVIGSWLEYEFDMPVVVGKISPQPIGGSAASCPESFIVEYYDGAKWVSLGTFSTTWPNDGKKWFNLVPIDVPSPYAKAKRWRVLTTTAGDSGEAAWGFVGFEDRFYAKIASTDGVDGVASASSEQVGFEAATAFDASVAAGTGWKATTLDAPASWIEFAFNTPQEVSKVLLAPIAGAGNAEDSPEGFSVQFFDGTAWQTVATSVTTWADNQSASYTEVGTAPPGTVPDPAPSDDATADGKLYGRRDGAWDEAAMSDLTDVDTAGVVVGDSLVWDGTNWIPGGGAIESFLDIEDVPNSYTGQAGKAAVVNVTEDGLEFQSLGATFVLISQAAYDALGSYDPNTLYCIPEA